MLGCFSKSQLEQASLVQKFEEKGIAKHNLDTQKDS